MNGPPFFIVGSARSGTTLLRLILNAHSEVAVPPESRFIVELWRGQDEVDRDAFLHDLQVHRRFTTWDLPIEAVAQELRASPRVAFSDAIDAAFSAYARVHGKARWGDKTPRYVEHMELLLKIFPDARFIHLIRDGRNVALSYADVPFGPKTVGKAAALWSRRVERGIETGRKLAKASYLEVLYEALVGDTEEQTKRICAFLELPFDPEMLNYTERARSSVLPRARTYNPHVTERPQANVRSWQGSMPEDHVEIFEAIAGDTLAKLGYERRFDDPSSMARIKARLSSWSLPVARLRRQTS